MSGEGAFKLSAVILAAGNSQRMGRPKMLLPWGGTTVIGHLLAQWKELGAAQTAVVVDGSDVGLALELKRLEIEAMNGIVNPDTSRGMFSSVQCAADWAGRRDSATHLAIVLGDQPHLQGETLAALVDFARRNPAKICQPGSNGRGKHPVIVPRKFFKDLARSKKWTLKEFLVTVSRDVKLMATSDTGFDLDIDLPEDYERAKKLGGAD